MRRIDRKSLLSWTIALGLLAPVCAQAGNVYRCGSATAPVYSDRPCAAGAQPLELATPNVMAAPKAPVVRDDPQAAKAAQRHRKEDSEWLQAYEQRKAAEDALRKGVVEGRVVPGMTQDQVERILNLPQSRAASGSTERWTYRNGSSSRVITFKDGLVADDGPGRSKHRKK